MKVSRTECNENVFKGTKANELEAIDFSDAR